MASVNRSPFAIIVAPDLWVRRFEVTVEPPAIAHPLRSFRTRAEAITAAEALSRCEGWPILDRCDADPGK